MTTKLCWKESYIPAKDGFSSLGNTFSIFWKKSWVTTTMSQLLTKARMGYLTSIGVLLRAGCFDWKYSWSEQIKSSWHIIPILFQTGNDTKPKVIITFYRWRNLRLNFLRINKLNETGELWRLSLPTIYFLEVHSCYYSNSIVSMVEACCSD